MFYFDTINGKKIMKSDLLAEVEHFFTTRESVIKSKESENLSLVNENRKQICDYLGIEDKFLVNPSQTHSVNIDYADPSKVEYPDCDGLILTNSEQAIFLNFADCTPIIIYDTRLKVGAISHAGWRGTAGRISVLTVQKMIRELGSNPSDIKAVVGPAISLCCYDVGDDVYKKLVSTIESPIGVFEKRQGKIFVDLKEINKRQLESVGVKMIDVCPYCTVCDNDLFFSYRKENATTNRHSALLKLNYAKRMI